MNFNNFTIKSQEAVQKAINLVRDNSQQAIEPAHIMMGVLDVGENVTNYLLQKLGVAIPNFRTLILKQIQSYPKVSGGSEPYLSREANAALQKANDYSRQIGDQFVSLEAVLMGLLLGGGTVSNMMKDAGFTEKELKAAIDGLRKGQKVDSQSAEDTYDALNKYATNLNELARTGKLDPVIGRDEEIRRVLQILSRRTKNNPILIGECY